MRTFTVCTNKGGVGKTTTSISLLDYWTKAGYRCLGIDLDAQGNLTHTAGVTSFDATAADLFLFKNAYPVQNSRGFDIVPANKDLWDLEAKIFSKYNAHSLLSKALDKFRGSYDVCIIDCNSHIDLVAQNALVAADIVVCPIAPEGWSIDGFTSIVHELENIRNSGLNAHVKIGAVVLSQFYKNRVLHQAIFEDFSRKNYELFTVADRISVREAQYQSISLFDYDPKGDATIQLGLIAEELATKYLLNPS